MTRKTDDTTPADAPSAAHPAEQAMAVPDWGAGHGGHPRCGALKRDGSGERCGQAAGWGTGHPGVGTCKLHLGSTSREENAARKVSVIQEAMKLAPHFERDEDPAEVLLSSLRHARALAAFFEDQIGHGRAPLHTTVFGGERKPSVEAMLWQAERDRADRIASTCIRLGLEERRVHIAEQVGDAMYAAVVAFAQSAGVSLDDDEGRSAFETAAQTFERVLVGREAERGLRQIERHLGTRDEHHGS